MKTFLTSCWDTLLRLSTYAHLLDHDINQYPLELPTKVGTELVPAATGVVFPPQNASAGFTCQYPTLVGWEGCNSAEDRSCWLNDPLKRDPVYQYNITTDYEHFTPPGITREYHFDVSVSPISPDGYLKPLGQVFNGSYPGPLLEACWGDELVVHVTNKDGKNGNTVHWHGLRQLGTNQMDGVNGVTQCPIAQNDTFTYTFRVGQYGHTWYHSHYQTQYSDGAAGPLTLYGPTSGDYDEALPPILVNDWVHENASVAFEQELNGGIVIMDNILLDGRGTFLCSDLDPRCCSNCKNSCKNETGCATSTNLNGTAPEYIFEGGKRYLLRLTCASAEAMFIFSIDGHNLTVIANDLVPIQPYTTKSLFIGIGQRYDVIVEANPSPASADQNYWIRTRVASACGSVKQDNEETGVLRYNASSTATPTTAPNDNRFLCEDEPSASLVPVVPWQVDTPQGNISDFTHEADIDKTVEHGFLRWELLDQPLFLNYSDPTILHVNQPNFTYSADYCVVPYNYTNGYVWLVITGENIDSLKRPAPAAHPLHLHGHDFVVLAQENSTFDLETALPKFNYNNPPRRDVALLPSGGYLAMAFRPDNPGVWLMHCHIAFHASSGLALQILERESEILASLGGENALTNTRKGCDEWEEWDLAFNQTDSGI